MKKESIKHGIYAKKVVDVHEALLEMRTVTFEKLCYVTRTFEVEGLKQRVVKRLKNCVFLRQ